jgi:hypothetical protein
MPVALVIQHVKYMSHIVICGLSESTIYLHIISYMAQFSGKKIGHKICVLTFMQLLSETFPILRGIRRGIIINAHKSSSRALVTLVKSQSNLILLDGFSKILKHQI